MRARGIRQHNERIWLAWHIAALSRQRRLPELASLLAKQPARPQTWQQQFEIAKSLQARGWGKFTKADPAEVERLRQQLRAG
jgi:hypothetical protein